MSDLHQRLASAEQTMRELEAENAKLHTVIADMELDNEYAEALTEVMQERDELKAQLTRLQERDREARERLKAIRVVSVESQKWADCVEWLDWRDAFLEKADG